MSRLTHLKAKWLSLPATLRGAIWMLLSGFLFAGLGTSIRMASRDIPTLEAVFFRNFFNLVLMLPWLIKIGVSGLKTNHLGLHFSRSIVGLISMFFWFAGFAVLPLAEATSLGFTAPLFATLGAALLLGEVVRLRRWIAVLVGFAGTLIILRPGLEIIQPEALYILAGALFVAGSFIMVKMLSRSESPTTMVLFMALFLTPLSFIPALFVWQWPTPESWLWLAGVGVFATGGHLLFNRAFAATEVTAVLPFDYCRLVFIAILAFVIFGEIPDIWTWIGGSIIFVSTIYIAHREAQSARNKTQDKILASRTSAEDMR